MKRRLSQAAFDTYVANPECAAYLASDILEKRLHQLLRLIADGEKFTVCEAADFVFLPSEVFRFVWAEVLATEHEAAIEAVALFRLRAEAGAMPRPAQPKCRCDTVSQNFYPGVGHRDHPDDGLWWQVLAGSSVSPASALLEKTLALD